MIREDAEVFIRLQKEKNCYRRLSSSDEKKEGSDEKPRADFSSNDYLGLSSHPSLAEGAIKAIEDFGAGSTGARLLSGNNRLYRELEEKTAAFKGKPASLVFNSGYQANVGMISSLCGPGDVIFCDRLSHASMMDGVLLSKARFFRFHHNDMDHLESLLQSRRKAFRNALIVTESVFSMDGDIAPLRKIAALKEKYETLLYVDEAHATGVFGENGAGMIEECGLTTKVDIIMGTFGKALGSFGAYVASERLFIDYFINKARSFIFSTALPPSVTGANLAALEVVRKESFRRKNLLERVLYFRNCLRKNNILISSFTPILPILLGEEGKAVEISRRLKDQGYLLPAIRFPTVPKGQARLRLSITYLHSLGLLENLSKSISGVLANF